MSLEDEYGVERELPKPRRSTRLSASSKPVTPLTFEQAARPRRPRVAGKAKIDATDDAFWIGPIQRVDGAPIRDFSSRSFAPFDAQKIQNMIDENQRLFERRMYILFAAILVLVLLLVGVFLFGTLYPEARSDDCDDFVDRRSRGLFFNCTESINNANRTLMADLATLSSGPFANTTELFVTCENTPTTSAGYGPPPSNSTAPPGSTYVNENTTTLYYLSQNQTWLVALNSSGTPVFSNTTCSVSPCATDLQSYGPWNASQPYVYGDIVMYNNNAYVALSANTGVAPTGAPNTWQLLIYNVTGLPGLPGPDGYTGATGLAGQCSVFDGAWNSTANYTTGRIVVYNETLYIATAPSVNATPSGNSIAWSTFVATPVGMPGLNGLDGRNGTNGINGTNGVNGTDGRDGLNGTDGVNGRNGLNGTDGYNGVNGTDGVNGTNGISMSYANTWNVSSTYSLDTFVLYQNAWYIALQNNTGVAPTGAGNSSSAWALFLTAVQGVNGTNGINGTNGVNGLNGTDGINGINGTNGINGINGTNGVNGMNGTNGISVLFRCTYNASIAYAAGNAVSYQNSVYYALGNSIGVTPGTNSSLWSDPQTPPPGTPGTNGTNGINGTNGLNGTSCPYINTTVPIVPGPYFYGVSYHTVTPQTFVNNVTTVLLMDQVDYDPNSWYNPATGVFAPKLAGWYQIYLTVTLMVPNVTPLNPLSLLTVASYTAIGGGIGTSRARLLRYYPSETFIVKPLPVSSFFNPIIQLDGTGVPPTGQLVLSMLQYNGDSETATTAASPYTSNVYFLKIA